MKNHYQIDWSSDKCTNPFECEKCLRVCPEAVFALYAPDRQEGVAPDKYVIAPALQYFCTGCGACTDVCPKDAITLTPKTVST